MPAERLLYLTTSLS